MKLNSFIILLFYSIFLFACRSSGTENRDPYLRPAAVSGSFYPQQKEVLQNMIHDLMKDIPQEEYSPNIFGLIVPHAGYIYSGQVAAYAYKQLTAHEYKTVFILGSAHRYPLQHPSIYPQGKFQTPLGETAIDVDAVNALLKVYPLAVYVPEAHALEHSLEVQLPFLQEVLGSRFKIVPILFGQTDPAIIEKTAAAIFQVIKGRNDVLIIASSDLSHYPDYKNANIKDKETVGLIQGFQVNKLLERERMVDQSKTPNLVTYQCGISPISTLLLIAKKMKNAEIKLLQYKNSGDVSWIKERVVGYCAMAAISKNYNNQKDGFSLTEEEKQFLLKIARETIEAYVKEGKIPKFDLPASEKLKQNAGAFVTLNMHNDLRGCIGYILPVKPLYQTVIENAVNSCSRDFRFNPVSSEELKDITIEISVLSPPQPVASYQDIMIGTHGIILKKGSYQSVFLPQVAPEQGWDLPTTLTHLSRKAGLGPDDWKKGAQFEVFTAIVFHETEK